MRKFFIPPQASAIGGLFMWIGSGVFLALRPILGLIGYQTVVDGLHKNGSDASKALLDILSWPWEIEGVVFIGITCFFCYGIYQSWSSRSLNSNDLPAGECPQCDVMRQRLDARRQERDSAQEQRDSAQIQRDNYKDQLEEANAEIRRLKSQKSLSQSIQVQVSDIAKPPSVRLSPIARYAQECINSIFGVPQKYRDSEGDDARK